MEDKTFENLIAQEFLRQRPNSTLKQLVEIIGLDLFSALLFNSNLQTKHVIFPSRSTLQRMLISAQIRSELRYLKPGSKNFKKKVSALSKTYGLRPFRILKIFESTK